jgi:hypothetical protein
MKEDGLREATGFRQRSSSWWESGNDGARSQPIRDRSRRADLPRRREAGRRGGLGLARARGRTRRKRSKSSRKWSKSSAAAAADAASRRRLSERIHEQPDQRHVHAVDRHAVPGVPVDRRLPCRLELLADVAHVRRDELPIGRRDGFGGRGLTGGACAC